MAARKRKILHDDYAREKIRVGMILDKFHRHLEGEIELSPTQVSVGKALINKVIPDLAAVSHSGNVDHTFVAELPPTVKALADWQQQIKTLQ